MSMFGFARVSALASAVALAGAAVSTSATAQEKIVRAHLTFSLTDMDSGTVFYVTRVSRLSWPNMDTCELRKSDVVTRQQAALEGIELVGAPVKGDGPGNVAGIPHRIGDADEGRRFSTGRDR